MSEQEVRVDWAMTPAEWAELRLALWDSLRDPLPLPYLRALAAGGRLGDPPPHWGPRPAIDGSGDIVPVPRQHLAWLFLLASRAAAGDRL